jgi:hypothetical protein
MKPRPAAILLIATLGALSLQAQSNTVIDAILAQKQATYEATAYMALVGGGWIDETASPAEAFALAVSKLWISAKAAPDAPADLATVSVLAMRGFRVKGGLGWSLFKNRRYAYRELVALGIANATGGPNRIPAGDEMIGMMSKLTRLEGAEK